MGGRADLGTRYRQKKEVHKKPALGIQYSAKSMLWAFVCELLITAGPLETLRIGLIF
jgi:hypothetical protein